MTVAYAAPIPLADLTLWDNTSGTATFATTGLRSGGGTHKMIAAAAGAVIRADVQHTARRVVVDTFYYNGQTTPSGTTGIYTVIDASGNISISHTSGDKLRPAVGGTSGTDVTIAKNVWHRIDTRVTVSGGVTTLEWYLNGVQQLSVSTAQADADLTASRLGVNSAATHTAWYMDHAGSYTSGDYPLGEYTAKRYDLDTVVGANHVTPGDFQKTGAVAITSADASSQAELVEQPFSVTSYIAQVTIGIGAYLEYPVADSAEAVPPVLVQAGIQFAGSATGAYSMELRLYDGTTEQADVLAAMTKSAATTRQTKVLLTSPPSGGSWTTAQFNALRWRFGFSADVTPNPRLTGLATMAVFRVPVSLTGAASLAQTDALAATGQAEHRGAASLAMTSLLTDSGVRTRFGAAALANASSLSGDGSRVAEGQALLAATSTASATGKRTRLGAASLVEQASLEATGVEQWYGAAALAGAASSLTATGFSARTGAASLTMVSLLTDSGARTRFGAAALAQSESLQAAGQRLAFGASSLPGLGSVSATGVYTGIDAAHLAGQGSLIATPGWALANEPWQVRIGNEPTMAGTIRSTA